MNEANTETTTTTALAGYAGDWPNDPINRNDPVWGLEMEAASLAHLAKAAMHIGEHEGQVEADAVLPTSAALSAVTREG